jgi:L-ribulokinase
MNRLVLGLDFGTESVRALLVDLRGREAGSAVVRYRHGQILEHLPGAARKLPRDFALQHPDDWLQASAKATRMALRKAGAARDDVIGIGVDFTSCTMLPCYDDGTPLCLDPRWHNEPYAWPKLWKHHGAKSQAERLTTIARERGERWLAGYGGTIGLEWFFPKVLETLEEAPAAYRATSIWIEAGDWLVWQLVGGDGTEISRSTCQAGYKGLWSSEGGFPSNEFLAAAHAKLPLAVLEKMPGSIVAPGESAGTLSAQMGRKFGLREGIPVSVAIIDAHAGVPGAGAAEPDTLVMVMGTSSCHMLCSEVNRPVAGVAGIVKDGILPGFYGYETGQAAVGDAFDWARRLVGAKNFKELSERAFAIQRGADGVRCVDWFNGCRTPLMDGKLSGSFHGLTLAHRSEHLIRSVLEASACGLRWIVDTLRVGGVPVRRFIATGGLPHHNPQFVQLCADVLGEPISIHPCQHGPALGAAIFGAMAAGKKSTGFSSIESAVKAMALPRGQSMQTLRPAKRGYDGVYADYRRLARSSAGPLATSTG